jgi:hypothetical protein
MAGFFTPGGFDDPSLPVNSALRQRIALAMLSAKKGYPKTLGEGLTAIGDALGDRSAMRRLAEADVADQREVMGAPATPAVPQPTAAYTPGDVTRSISQEPQARAETPLYTAPSQATAQPSSTSPQPTLRDMGDGQVTQSAGAGTSPSSSSPAASDEEAGGYNVIDAQAGTKMQQSPEYARAAIARATRNPDMQAYLGNLVAKESPRPNDVSRTGARGPFQFVPGTARQYGLTDPDNPDAAAQAALQLTGDNAAQFTKRFGRPPTMQELAVMHQQGAGGGGNLMAGRGTDPRNLAVNNIAANASPQAAVSRINNFYGMPDRTVDPRAGVAQALMAQGGGQTPPVMNADDQQAALPPANGPVNVPPASLPPVAAPPMQVAQAPPAGQPAPIPGYVTPQPGQAPAPRQIQPSEEEMRLQNYVTQLGMRNPYAASSPQAMQLQRMQADRAAAQAVENKRFESNLMIQRDQLNKSSEQRATQVERMNADLQAKESIRKARMENNVLQDFGGLPPQQVFEKADKSSAEAKTARDGLIAADSARKAILSGAILGAGADWRLGMAKINRAVFGKEDAGSAAANTELFRSSMAPVVASLLGSTVGRTQVSNTDRDFAERAAGGQINLEPTTIKRLLDITGRLARDKLDYHDAMINTFGANSPQFKAMFGVPIPEDLKGNGKPLLSPQEKEQIDGAENFILNHPRDPRTPAIRRQLGYK